MTGQDGLGVKPSKEYIDLVLSIFQRVPYAKIDPAGLDRENGGIRALHIDRWAARHLLVQPGSTRTGITELFQLTQVRQPAMVSRYLELVDPISHVT